MSSQMIRKALGLLQDDADNESAWLELQDAMTSPDTGMTNDELVDLLVAARREHESRREWRAVANLIEYEIMLTAGTSQEVLRQAELARVLEDELLEDAAAVAAYKRLLELRPDDPTALEAIERSTDQRQSWRQLTQRKFEESQSVQDHTIRSSMLCWIAETTFRHGRDEVRIDQLMDLLEQAIKLDSKNRRACLLLERLYKDNEQWEDAARVLEILATESASRDEQYAAWIRLARVIVRKIGNEARGVAAYERVLDLYPGCPEAMSFLADFFGRHEQWEHLVNLYEDQLRSGGFKSGQDFGILLQIAMVQWRMRERPDLAEPYFEKVRRAEPAHPGMISFYEEWCEAQQDGAKLLSVLTDAQRASTDQEQKTALATRIAKLAETQEDSRKAIDQYKALLRQDSENVQARDALKRLYRQTSAWTSLVDLLRRDLDDIDEEDGPARLQVLHEIADIYRDNIKSDSALVTVLGQILSIDDSDIDAVRELCRVYEALQRWRDLLVHQQKLAELTDDKEEKLQLLRSAGQRWTDQFQNVQNATEVYERIVDIEPSDADARQRLRELYLRRRAWAQLYTLLEKDAQYVEGEAKIEVYGEMAKLAAERLGRSADAIALYKKIFELDPQVPGVLDALERQAERDKDFETVAEVLEHRVKQAQDDNARVTVLQKLGAVYAEHLSDPRRAAGAWRKVLEIRPDHSRAMRVLRESYLAAEDYDAITALYAQNEDWEGLADVLSSAADRATSTDAKIDLSYRTAEVYETRLNAPERAFRSYERVLSVNPTDLRAANALVPIYENDERWSRLPALYEILLAQSESNDEKLSLLNKLAYVTGDRLSDKDVALTYARQAYELAPDAPDALEQLEERARAANSWQAFVDSIESRIAEESDMPLDLQRSLKLRLAQVYAVELGRTDDAIKTYRALVEQDPTDDKVVTTLDGLLRAASRHDDLRWLFELRIEQASTQDAVHILTEWATLEEDAFNSPSNAIELYRRALELDPSHEVALASLPRLLLSMGDAAGAAQVVEAHRDRAQGAARGELELMLAQLCAGPLDRPEDALDACERALELEVDHPRIVEVLDILVTKKATRARAAAVLVDLHADLGDPQEEAASLSVLINSVHDPVQRRELFGRLADVYENKLHDPKKALDVALTAVGEFPEDLSLWDMAKDLAILNETPGKLAHAYHAVLEQEMAGLKGALEIELCQRAARLNADVMGDQQAAVPYLKRVLERDPGNEQAFHDLKEIQMAHEQWGELEVLYARAIQGTEDEEKRVELLAEVGLICEEIIEDSEKAMGYYERILKFDPFHPAAMQALEKLYAADEQYDKLVALLERRLERAQGQVAIDIKLRLGKLHLDNLNAPEKALPHVQDVLLEKIDDPDARALAEQILQVPELRAEAARTLERVYEARGEIRDLARVLDIRLAATQDEDQKRDLLRRVAMLREDRLADDKGALEALSMLVPMDPVDEDARERMMKIGQRLGAHAVVADVLTQAAECAVTPEVRGSILMDVASIYRDQIADISKAEATYQKVVALDSSDPYLVIPAARALEEIYAGLGNHKALVDILRTEVRLEHDAQRRAEIHGRLGEICESILEDPQGAIEAWKARLEDDPVDSTALASLDRLYEKTESWRSLVDVLRIRQDGAQDGDERRQLMTRTAEVLTDRLDDVGAATIAWRAIVDEFGPEQTTLVALEALYEKASRWMDLAETLEMHLNLELPVPERLSLMARLGDVRRTHLNDIVGALDAYRQALTFDPVHQPSRDALERLLDSEPARREAAQILHPLYEAEASHEKLLRVVEIEAESSLIPEERLDLLAQAVRVAEGPLNNPSRAFDFAVNGLKQAADTDDVSTWLETVERLAQATGKYPEFVTLLRDVVSSILDGHVQIDVTLRIADLARTELADRNLARDYYIKALDIQGDDRRALIALESLYEEAGDGPALLDIIRRRVDSAEDDKERKELLFRQARLCSEALQDTEAAIDVYETILDIDMDPVAIEQLETLYQTADRPADLVVLYERQLETQPENEADLRVKIARVAQTSLSDSMRAFDELGDALATDSQNPSAIAELERLLKKAKDPEHRARAAEMLEPYYLSRADWKLVKQTIAARLQANQDSEKRRELLRRLAVLQEEQEEDFAGALETTAKLLHEDITDEDTWRQLESQARVAGAERRLAEIYAAELEHVLAEEQATAKLSRRTGELFASLGEVDKSLVYYNRALDFDPESPELFSAIDEILIKADRHSDRVELYRKALDHRFDATERLHTYHTIAELERKSLGQPEKAIETYIAALDVDHGDAVSLDALTELYRELERFDDLAELYLRRAETDPDPDRAGSYRLALARLQRDRMDDSHAAIDQLEEIVRQDPTNRAATADLEAMLEDDELKARVVDILLPIYQGGDDWRKQVFLNAQRYDLTNDDLEKVSILRETAHLWEDRGTQPERAFEAYRAAFEIDPEDEQTRQDLERLAQQLGCWDELAEAYEMGVKNTDGVAKRDLLSALALVHDQKRDDPRSALEAYGRLYDLDETDVEPLEKMDFLATLLADWEALVTVLTKKAELVGSDEDRSYEWRRVGECKRDMLEDTEGAIQAFERAFELDPISFATVDNLIALYEQVGNGERLVDLYQRRVELAGDSDNDLKYQMLIKAADQYQTALNNNQEAIIALRHALDVRPADVPVLHKLDALFRKEQMWSDLLDTLRLQASVAENVDDRVKLRREAGQILADQMHEPAEALDAFRLVFDEAPSDDATIEAVQHIGDEYDELRLDAADVLEPVLRSAGKYDKLVDVLEMRLHGQHDVRDRALTLRSMANVLSESLSKKDKALDALIRALNEAPEDLSLHDDIEHLAKDCDGYKKYADALENSASKVFDSEVATGLWTRLGRISEQQLGDDARAVTSFTKALELTGDAPELLESLDRLHSKLKNSEQLADILERRVMLEHEPVARGDLYYRLAVIQIESFGNKSQGLDTLSMALAQNPSNDKACEKLQELTLDRDLFEEASSVLENVYRTRSDYSALADLYEKRISFAKFPSDRLRMRLDLAGVLQDQAGDSKRAQRVIEAALGDDVADPELLERLGQLAQINEQWPEAAQALSSTLEATDGVDTTTMRDLYVHLAQWYRDKLSDPAAAENATKQALKRDPDNIELIRSIELLQRVPGRERDLVATLRRRGVLEFDTEKRRELFREAHGLARSALDDRELSEQVLRQLIELDDGYLWAYSELVQLREDAQDYPQVVDLLLREAQLTASGPGSIELRHKAAHVLVDKLHEDERAIDIYEEIIDADPMDQKAAKMLRELYVKHKRNEKLADLLDRLIDVAHDSKERNDLRYELAQLFAEQFNRVDDAVFVLLRVLEDEPGHTQVVVLLSQLYEKADRVQDLADLLDSQIALAKQNGDAQAELTFMVRLGEVYESKLDNKKKAIETYQAVLERDDKNQGALVALGRLFESQGDSKKAAEILERLLSLVEGQQAIELALQLADIFGTLDDNEGAKRVLERGLTVDADTGELRKRLRALYEKTNEWKKVAKMLAEDALLAKPDAERVRLLQQAADILMSKCNDAAGAAELLEQASKLAPDDRDLLLALCDAYSESGRGKDAIVALQQIVDSYGGKRVKELAAIYHRLAKAHVSEGDKKEGLAQLDQAFRITPGNLDILVDLGRLALDLEDLERAQKTFRALLLQRLDADSPITKAEVFYYLGDISHRQGDKQKATQMLERAIDNDGELEVAKELLAKIKG